MKHLYKTAFLAFCALPALLALMAVAGCNRGKQQGAQSQTPPAASLPPAGQAAKEAPLADGRPGGWPIPELTLPPGADTANPAQPPAQQRPFGPGALEWSLSFRYPNTWDALVDHLDSCLAPLGYVRVKGNKNDRKPEYPENAQKLRIGAEGQKTYLSKDGKTFVFLFFTGLPTLHSSKPDENYRLQVLVFEQPQEVKAPSYTEPIS